MLSVRLLIKSSSGESQHELTEGAVATIGRTDASTIPLESDHGLSRRHATFSLKGGEIFVVDEGSTNGSYLNGSRVPTTGAMVTGGDEVRIGNNTVVKIIVSEAAPESVAEVSPTSLESATKDSSASILKYLIPAILIAFVVLFVVGIVLYKLSTGPEVRPIGNEIASSNPEPVIPGPRESVTPSAEASELPNSSPTPEPVKDVKIIESTSPVQSPVVSDTPPPPSQRKLYKNMTEDEQKEFIKQRAQHVAIMMGKRPYAFTPEALVQIKFWLDAFTRRAGNNKTGLWGGDTVAILQRGKVQAPLIIRSFQESRVPYVVGLYIPFIETEYNNIASNNAAGAAGLFQFLGPTAEYYGVPASERTNVAKMAPEKYL